ncbi:MAG TPA: glycosyltransferase, partial [bacterium]|nr:glycosyltransferase [bacterium]
GDRRAALERRAAENDLAGAVELLGPRPHSEVKHYYHWADTVALSSVVTERGETEGMPVVIAEALAAGAPVAATRISSVADVIHEDENGALAQPGDATGLAEAILRLLHHPQPERLSAAAQASAQPFDWREIAATYNALYRELIG